jgi:hypothetical protein
MAVVARAATATAKQDLRMFFMGVVSLLGERLFNFSNDHQMGIEKAPQLARLFQDTTQGLNENTGLNVSSSIKTLDFVRRLSPR